MLRRNHVQCSAQDFRRLVSVFRGHCLKIEVQLYVGVVLAEAPPLSSKVFESVQDLICNDGIGDTPHLERAVFLTVDLISHMGESFV